MMVLLAVLLAVAGASYFVVLLDMVQKTRIFFLPLGILLPIGYVWVLFRYSGNRVLVGSMLWGSTAVLCLLLWGNVAAAF